MLAKPEERRQVGWRYVVMGLTRAAPLQVDLDAVCAVFPYGKILPIEVVHGGLTFQSGRVRPYTDPSL